MWQKGVMKFLRHDGQRLRMPVAAEDWSTMSSIESAGQHSRSSPSSAERNSSRDGHIPRIRFSRASSRRGTAKDDCFFVDNLIFLDYCDNRSAPGCLDVTQIGPG